MQQIKDKLFNFSEAIESVNIFKIIRTGLTSASPIIIIGAMSLMLASFPVPAYQELITELFGGKLLTLFRLIYSCSFDMLSLYMLITISHKYACSFSDDNRESIIVSLISLASFCALNGNIIDGEIRQNFDSTQLFSAIICSIITVRFYYMFKFKTKKRETYFTVNSDSGFAISVNSIVPALVIILLFACANLFISYTFDVDSLQGLFSKCTQHIFSLAGEGFFSMLLYTFLVHFLWLFGIHGNNVLEPVMQENFFEVGGEIFSKGFYDTFISIGGSGACLCVVIAMLLVARTKELRYVSKLGAVPVLFNISEIISIGVPLLFNPVFFIPFIFVPILNGTIAYVATYIGLIPVIDSTVTWTTPIFFSGYYATGSISVSILQLILLVMGTLCYIPFVKMYEERLRQEAKKSVQDLVSYMEECERLQKTPDFLKRNDIMGQTAKVLALDLKEAIKEDKIYFYYQPQINSTEQCIGCEALIRWNHPTVGLIYPPLIIQLAKETNILKEVDRLLIEKACQLIKEVETECQCNIKVSINLTVSSLLENNLETLLSNALYKYGVRPSSLWIELTENEVFTSAIKVTEALDKLQEKGHKLLIDDFGMGHTSIKYLQANKFNVIKLDASLTQNIQNNEVNQKIIHSISELGDDLGFDLIAEYVETEPQRNKLMELGCDYYQGYLYSKPLRKTEFIEYYKKNVYIAPGYSQE